jgi:hypothetical protein
LTKGRKQKGEGKRKQEEGRLTGSENKEGSRRKRQEDGCALCKGWQGDCGKDVGVYKVKCSS